jgi:epoxyqueuosine reductase
MSPLRRIPDAGPDPIDRWSRRVIGHMACDLGAKALFPFGGPPWHPFIAWALRSGRAWQSPVGFLVHDQAGLMVSYRGALALSHRHRPARHADAAPCADLRRAMPCRLPGRTRSQAQATIRTPATLSRHRPEPIAWNHGCAVRRACPLSRSYGRLPEQSAYHMRRFHP